MQVEWVSMYLVNWRSALSMLGVMDRGYAPVYSMSERLVWKPGMSWGPAGIRPERMAFMQWQAWGWCCGCAGSVMTDEIVRRPLVPWGPMGAELSSCCMAAAMACSKIGAG